VRNSIKSFQLDDKKNAFIFDSMAPTKKYNESISIKKDEDEPLAVRFFERDDVVSESIIPPVFKWFVSLFQRKRPLQPHELQPIQDTVINISTKLHVRISQIINEPIRTKMSMIPSSIKDLGYSSEQDEKCSYFVIATIGNEMYKTEPVKAVESFWKADFEFDIGSHKNSLEETLNITIFDRMKYSFPEGEEEEAHYLGEINIPVLSIQTNGKTKGDFVISVPPLHLGYSCQNKPMLLMELNFSPNISPSFSNNNKYYVNGCHVELSALITPHNPPNGVNNVNSLMRFTSAIPWVKNTENFILVSQEFIDQGFGTTLEHAIFFCNCLLSLNKRSYVVIADDAFLGDAAFVYTNENGVKRFYDAVNNKVYSGPPFRRIRMAFNETGVWINTNPNLISLDFDNSENWTMIDDGSVPKVQDSEIVYAPTEVNIEELQEMLTNEIKEHVSTLLQDKVSWNKSLSLNLEAILDKCEEAAEKRNLPDEADFFSDSSNIRAGGAPFCTYFNKNMTTEELILTISVSIQNQMLYQMKGPKTKLGLSVKAYPHPNGIVAVWVFIATIQQLPKQETI
jgi:hypothetical protein